MDSISEDLISSMDSKSPSVKIETALFMARCFAHCTLATLPKKVLKPLVVPLVKVKIVFGLAQFYLIFLCEKIQWEKI